MQNKNKKQEQPNRPHQPVLLEQVLGFLAPQKGESYLDLTAGYGGHAEAVIDATKTPDMAVLVDRDPEAVHYLKARFNRGERIVKSDFAEACEQGVAGGQQFDMILADLGASSVHFDDAARGFSFSQDGPLDMRMDTTQKLTADDIVNTWPTVKIAKILREYGQEPKASKIADLITKFRPIHTTRELANIVKKAWPGRSKTHPATRTFQALRIAVNNEIVQLKQALPLMTELLAPAGRLVIISFHSLEDKLVKEFLKSNSGNRYDASLHLLTASPVMAGNDELVFNPRARSAKLRAAVKINNQTERSF